MVEVEYQAKLLLTNLNDEQFNTSVKIISHGSRYLVILHVDKLEQTADVNKTNGTIPLKLS